MNQRKVFTPYVIQIGTVAEVLYVNYSSDIEKSYRQFLHKRTHLRNSPLRTDLFDQTASYTSGNKANRASLELIDQLEANGYEVIAGGPLLHDYWQTYVIEIEGNPEHLYVGETNYPIIKRYQQHVYKYNPARIFLKYNNFELAMHHADHLPICKTKQDSMIQEAHLAEVLRQKGYRVEGGH